MDIAKRLNRDFYIKMRLKGYSHSKLVESTFPPERKEKFSSDVADLESVDFAKKVNVEKLIEGDSKSKEVKSEIPKKPSKKVTKKKS